MRVVTHPRVLRQPLSSVDAWDFVRALLASPSLRILTPTQNHAELVDNVLHELPELGNSDIFDLRLAVLMREHGVTRIVTRDSRFQRFRFLEVIDPLT